MQFLRVFGANRKDILLLQKCSQLRLELSVTRDHASQTTSKISCPRADLRNVKDRCADQTVICNAKHLEFRLELFYDSLLGIWIENRKGAAAPTHSRKFNLKFTGPRVTE